jgi:hypothetical protein
MSTFLSGFVVMSGLAEFEDCAAKKAAMQVAASGRRDAASEQAIQDHHEHQVRP